MHVNIAQSRDGTCSHRRWFQAKRGPDVCVARPFPGSRGGAGTGPSPSFRSPGGRPGVRAEGRKLDPKYLRESACHWRHVPFTELRFLGEGRICESLLL